MDPSLNQDQTPGQDQDLPFWVKGIGLVNLVLAVWALLLGGAILGSMYLNGQDAAPDPGIQKLVNAGVGGAVRCLTFAGVGAASGIGLWKVRRWGVFATLVFYFLAMVVGTSPGPLFTVLMLGVLSYLGYEFRQGTFRDT